MNNILVYLGIALIIGYFFNRIITSFFGKILNVEDKILDNKIKNSQKEIDITKEKVLAKEGAKPIADKDASDEDIEKFWDKNSK